MGYAEKRGKTWRARWYGPDGRLESMSGFTTKRAAEQYAADQEAKIREGRYINPRSGKITVTEWVNQWFPALDLELSTLENYRWLTEVCILPAFGARTLDSITTEQVDAWEADLVRVHGYSRRTAHAARSVFSACLGAAVPTRIPANPASRRRSSGKRAERRIAKVMEQRRVWATPLEALLVAERMAAISGHQGYFVLGVFLAYTGARWSEAVGLTPECLRLRDGVIDLDWKLYELNGYFYRSYPKAGSVRTIDMPPFLAALLQEHLAKQGVARCTCPEDAQDPYCRGAEYVFLGPEGGHPRRSDFTRRFFRPAADGWYTAAGGKNPRPAAPVLADVSTCWPGRVISPPWPVDAAKYPRGRGIHPLPEGAHLVNWLPIIKGLTPHGLRHSHETWMAEDRIPDVLRDERIGHENDGGMRDLYTHVTPQMREELVTHLQERWEQSLAARAALEEHWHREYGVPRRSPVPILDRLLEPLRGKVTPIEAARSARVVQRVRAVPAPMGARSTPILLPKSDIQRKGRGRSQVGNGL